MANQFPQSRPGIGLPQARQSQGPRQPTKATRPVALPGVSAPGGLVLRFSPDLAASLEMRSPLRARPGAHCAYPASTASAARPRASAVVHTLSPSPAQLRLASQAPRTDTQPATEAAVRGTSAHPAAAAAILAHPAPVAAADVSDGYVSARPAPGSPRLSPSSSLSLPRPLPRPHCPAPLALLRTRPSAPQSRHAPFWLRTLSRPGFRPFILLSRPYPPRPSPLAPPFRHAPLDSAPRSRPVFRCLIPPSHLVGPAPPRQSFTAPPPWPRPSPTCRVQSAGPASRRRPGYAGSVLQDSCFRI